MKFEIINPSDKCFIEGDFLSCALTTVVLSNGKYGLVEVDEHDNRIENGKEMPIFLFGGHDEWFKENFGKAFEECSHVMDYKSCADALNTFRYRHERSSMNNIGKIAKEHADWYMKKHVEQSGTDVISYADNV